MNEEFKNSLNKFLEKETYIVAYRSNYDSARQFNNELIDYIKQLQQELTDYKERNEKAIEYNKQNIKDIKSFYRPTSDAIYSGDCLIDIAEQNIEILDKKANDE